MHLNRLLNIRCTLLLRYNVLLVIAGTRGGCEEEEQQTCVKLHGPRRFFFKCFFLFLAPCVFAERERTPTTDGVFLYLKQNPKSQDTKITHTNIKEHRKNSRNGTMTTTTSVSESSPSLFTSSTVKLRLVRSFTNMQFV